VTNGAAVGTMATGSKAPGVSPAMLGSVRLPWRQGEREDPATLPDDVLAARVAHGDTAAFHRLVDRHLAAVVSFGRRLLGNGGEGEDVAQEAFLRFWRAAQEGGPPIVQPRAWLLRVAYRHAIDRQRRRKVAQSQDADFAALATPGPSGERAIRDRELSSTVERVVAALPERQRAAVLLCHHEGLGNSEAADVMGVSVEALESLLARARRTLRRQLDQCGASDLLDPLE
jgi:RNA polymerase sigma-70 factor (ECF subfamily)